MQYINHYESPMGGVLLAADGEGLTGLWFEGGKHYAEGLAPGYEEKDLPVFGLAKHWLTVYFSGREPDFLPPLHLEGSPFRMAVWEVLRGIPYGKTVSYGEIAKAVAKRQGLSGMSAQAVGGAVGHNRVSILVPCHRVVGADGNLTGYAGGLDRKARLLALEKSGLPGAGGRSRGEKGEGQG